MSLVDHAAAELAAIGCEEPERTCLLATVGAFAAGGWSGGSAPWAIAVLTKLLSFEPLTGLTCDPDEWMRICDERTNGEDLWQSRRRSEAFSHDGGTTYYLLSEREAAGGSLDTTPMHRSAPAPLKSAAADATLSVAESEGDAGG